MERAPGGSGGILQTGFNEQIGRQPDLKDQLEIAGMGAQPALVFTDQTAGHYVLDSIDAVGDVDQDGIPDYAVGSSQAAGVYGRLTVYSGLTGEILKSLNGEAIDDRFGISVAGAGDPDQDGFPDVVVGAFWNSAGGTDAGRVYVYSGKDWSLLASFTGSTGDALGFAADGAGDVNGDGHDDVIAGAFGYSEGTGRAYVYSGKDWSALFTFTGNTAFDNFGQAVAVAGARDANGDGNADVVVGAPWTGGGLQIGEVTVFSGATGAQLLKWTEPSNYGGFGFSVDGAGDVDGDGFGDVIVGQAYANSGNGAVHVFSGKNGQQLHAFYGSFNANLGYSVSSAGDVNRDGHADLLAGATLDRYPSHRGRAFVFDGKTGALLADYAGQALSSYCGHDVAPAGNLNGDGYDDVFVGAQWWSPLGNGAGRADVFLSPNPAACATRKPKQFQ